MAENELTQILSAQPAELEKNLGVAMQGIGLRIVERPEVVRGLSAGGQLKPGYVISSETQAVEVADLVAQIIDGEKALAEQTKVALRIPKAMETALKGAVDPARLELARARQEGNTARVAWQNELRRRAALEEEKRRQEAAEAARQAAEEASEGEEAPPPADIAPVEVPRTVAGGTGKMGTMVRIEAVAIVDMQHVPFEWLSLARDAARASFLAAERAGLVKRPAPGEGIVWKGVRFEARESAVNRR